VESVRTVESATVNGEQVWRVIEEAQMPTGSASDSTIVARETLMPVRRVQRQGPAVIEMDFAGDSVTGRIRAGSQNLPIRARAGGALFADGAPLQTALGTLPLEPGYTSAVRVFDVLSGSVKLHRVEVVAVDHITVPAGDFDAVRVEITPPDGAQPALLWFERAAPHRLLRVDSPLPAQAGGGRAVTELTG
jgi:hypothetical protein